MEIIKLIAILSFTALAFSYVAYSVVRIINARRIDEKTKIGKFMSLKPQNKVILLYKGEKVIGTVVNKSFITKYVVNVNGSLINMDIHSFIGKF